MYMEMDSDAFENFDKQLNGCYKLASESATSRGEYSKPPRIRNILSLNGNVSKVPGAAPTRLYLIFDTDFDPPMIQLTLDIPEEV